jgi:predicted ArsR family transcriptional regulator
MTSTYAKALGYLKGRKTPASAEQIATHFLLDPKTIRRALNELKEDGLADFEIKQGANGRNARLWAYRHPVAVPNVAPEPRPPERASTPRQWSVYDDRSYD